MGSRKRYLTVRNNLRYISWRNRLLDIALASIGWEGLPDSVNERYLEWCLCLKTAALFFKDDELGFVCLPSAAAGTMDIYNEPRDRAAYSVNGQVNVLLDEDNSVLIYNNFARTGLLADIDYYATTLANIDGIIDVNLGAQRTPVLLVCDESERFSMEQMYNQLEDNMPAIKGTKGFESLNVKALNTQAPYVGDKLTELQRDKINQFLTLCGFSNMLQKAERRISAEIAVQAGDFLAFRNSRLEARKQAAEKINRMFGLSIKPYFREGGIVGGVYNDVGGTDSIRLSDGNADLSHMG